VIEHRHLPHVSSFRDNPIVFFTACTHKRRKLLACAQSQRSQENYGQKWNYVAQNASRAGLIKEGEEWQYRGSIFDLMW
jgi:hypothetical protein